MAPNTPESSPEASKKGVFHQDTNFPFHACLHQKSSDNAPFSYRVRPVRKPKATHTFRTRKSRRRWDGQLQNQHGSSESKANPGTTTRTGGLRRRVVLADLACAISPKVVVTDDDDRACVSAPGRHQHQRPSLSKSHGFGRGGLSTNSASADACSKVVRNQVTKGHGSTAKE